jgi:F420-dependent oxidoreductase-like protein
MKLGLFIGYSGAQIRLPVETVQQAERLGYDSVWTAEAYGSDAVTPLAYLAAKTERIRLGTGIMQMPARTPAMTAMTMSTLDQLAGGDRVIVGLGLSGPQVVEGWHGQPWGSPVKRTREYVEVLRKMFAREEPVTYDGDEYQLPYTGPGSAGLGKPLKSILHMKPLPIYLATLGPANVKTTAELADGWLPMWFSPQRMDVFRPWLEEGFARAGNGKGYDNFEIQPACNVIVSDDVQECFRQMKPNVALYMGGMGARGKNFHNDVIVRYGYGDVAERIQDLYLNGQRAEALEAVPDELCDEISLVGPADRIRERYRIWEDSGITALSVQSQDPVAIELMADITGASRGA